MLIGHREQQAQFLEALEGGRLHHAWLITGPRGIGKRAFADWAALELLGQGGGKEQALSLIEAGSHPDHRLLEPPVEGRGAATRSIVIDQLRELGEFLHSYPAIAPWRTLIVDAIDDMNPNASNSFLKELEEPREKTIYFLLCNSPGKLLPTIRSRCRTLRMAPLEEEDCRRVLEAQFPEKSGDEIASLARLANGAPGAVISLADADLAGLEQILARLENGGDPLTLVRAVSAASAAPRLEALLAMVPRRLAQKARRSPHPLLFSLYDEAIQIANDAARLAYMPGQVAMALADIMARAGRIKDTGPAI